MKKKFVGTCVNILEDGNLSHIMSDATDMAQIEENAIEITFETFKENVEIPEFIWNIILKNEQILYLMNEEYNLFILYDDISDVHYFFI